MHLKNIETEGFCKRVFEQFDIQYSEEQKNSFKTRNYDLLFHSNEQSIFVEVKSFRDKNVPLSRLTKTIENLSLLSNNTNNISVLVVFGNVANVDKSQIYLDYGVTLWDISNLLFYIKDNFTLQYNLTKILPFSIASIEPQESSGWLPTYPLLSPYLIYFHKISVPDILLNTFPLKKYFNIYLKLFPCYKHKQKISQKPTPFYFFNSLTNSLVNAGKSSGRLDVTKLSHTTTSAFSYTAPAFIRSSFMPG